LTNSRGQFKFIGLNKGKYYMTAILKEYEFDQGQVSLEVNDGEQIEKILRAKRIA